MRIVDLLFSREPRDTGLSEAARKWNLMWDLWSEGKAASPFAEMMTYSSEVNNGGHGQYFENTACNMDLAGEVEAMLPALPPVLRDNLKRAYDAYLTSGEEEANDGDVNPLWECDVAFGKNEQLLNDILQGYANTLTLPKKR